MSRGSSKELVLPRHPLAGRFVTLEPLAEGHSEALRRVFNSDEDAWQLIVNAGHRRAFRQWWSRTSEAMRREESLIFAVRRVDGSLVGTTGYLTISREHRRVEIGSTFYHPSARGGPVNPECKLLLMDAIFRGGAFRVEFMTDARNSRSRAALRKLGAIEEGILRRHKLTWTGWVRDSVLFSVTDLDWPEVRDGLEARLAQFEPPQRSAP